MYTPAPTRIMPPGRDRVERGGEGGGVAGHVDDVEAAFRVSNRAVAPHPVGSAASEAKRAAESRLAGDVARGSGLMLGIISPGERGPPV